jgi:hypothetical protein
LEGLPDLPKEGMPSMPFGILISDFLMEEKWIENI